MIGTERNGERYDVVVAGGGTAGCSAALAAARAGARTLLLERNGVLGGTATSGLMVSWGVKGRFWDGLGEQVLTGIPWEVHGKLVEEGSGHASALARETAPFKMVFEPEHLKGLLIDLLLQARVEILTHTMACDPILADRRIDGLFIENKSGRARTRASQYIDCTGDMDLCRRAGIHQGTFPGGHSLMMRVGGVDQQRLIDYIVEHRDLVRDSHEGMYTYDDILDHYYHKGYLLLFGFAGTWLGNLNPFAEFFREALHAGAFTPDELEFHAFAARGELRDGAWGIDMQGLEGRAGTDVVDVWAMGRCFDGCDARAVAEFEMRGHQRCRDYFRHVIRRLPGFEKAHLLEIAADAGVRGGVAMDCDYTFTGEDIAAGRRHPDCIGRWASVPYWDPKAPASPVRGADVPLQMLLPKRADNLLIAGRFCAVLRSIPSCMVMGQGAGIAAALAAHRGTSLRGLCPQELQSAARAQNVNVG